MGPPPAQQKALRSKRGLRRFPTLSGMPGPSPPPWGCFLWLKRVRKYFDVFPTHVGVFPILDYAIHQY